MSSPRHFGNAAGQFGNAAGHFGNTAGQFGNCAGQFPNGGGTISNIARVLSPDSDLTSSRDDDIGSSLSSTSADEMAKLYEKVKREIGRNRSTVAQMVERLS